MLGEDLFTFILPFMILLSWDAFGNFEEFGTGVKTAEVHTVPPDRSTSQFPHPRTTADNNVYFLRWS